MTIANPLAWGLLLLAIPIILFFFLKVRFRKELVTTMIFWQRVFEERRARKLHPRFRSLLSLLIALLFLTFLTAAVLDPVRSGIQDQQCILIIDNSATMNALSSDGISRLDTAKHQAQKQLEQFKPGQHVAILSANIDPQIISGFTDHSRSLRRKLAEIPATDFPADLSAALHLSEQLIADSPNTPIYVYTGGTILSPLPNVHIVHVGQPLDNLAITRFQPRRLPEHVADYEILMEAVNFGVETVQTRIEIDREGKIVDVLPLSLEPNVPITKIVRNTSSAGGLFRVTLTDTDSFPTDNTAVAFLSEQFVQRVLLYGEPNYFLWHVLQAQPQTEIVVIENIPDTIPPDNVLVIHQRIPATLPPGNVMVIDPQNDGDLFQVGKNLESPMTATVDTENSLVRFVQQGLVFAGAKNVIPQKSTFKTLLATADDFPLYLQFVSDDQRTLVLTADLNQGDLSLRTAFPILMTQALAYFRNSEELLKAYSTAEPVNLTLQTEHIRVILRSPSGHEEVVPCQDGSASLGRLGECGVWTILEPESGRTLSRVACNLCSASESNLRSADVPVQIEAESEVVFSSMRPIWCYLALLALLLTAAEWWLYQRRWLE